jgi:ubiquinone/menaquinone biosynthesis C-methylase UbiE
MIDYDAELQLHDEQFRAAADIQTTDRVLDIGCGTGQTTRNAARAASAGAALGVDVHEGMITRARELAEGIPNLQFEVGDAQTYAGAFDVAISRFGTMFFKNPELAFRNIARALRTGGRLAIMVWQAHHLNEWATLIEQALAEEERSVAAALAPPAFSLAEPSTVQAILTTAGFTNPVFREIDVPVYYGPTVDAALDFVGQFANVKEALNRSGSAADGAFIARLRTTFASRASARGVWLGSRSWIVTADRSDKEIEGVSGATSSPIRKV